MPVLFSPVLLIGTASAQSVHSPSDAVQAAVNPAPAVPAVPSRAPIQAKRSADPVASAASDGDLQLTLASSPRFTTASMTQVKYQPVLNGVGGPKWNSTATSLDYHIFPLSGLVLKAWPMPNWQIGGPAWIVDGRSGNVNGWYDVSATMPADTTPEQLQVMFQGMLVDQLKMQAHWETRSVSVYALKIANGGVKFQKSANPAPEGYFTGGQGLDGFLVRSKGPMQPETGLSGTTMATFVAQMSAKLDNPMVDMTGLEGVYDIDLFVPRDLSLFPPGPFQPLTGPGPFTKAQRNANWGFNQATFFDALETQLGLIAEPQTVSARYLVIDSITQGQLAN